MSSQPAEVTSHGADIRADFSLLIDGAAANSSSILDVINPATGRVFACCPAAGRDELDRAVAAARRAFPAWRDLSYAQRAELSALKEEASFLPEVPHHCLQEALVDLDRAFANFFAGRAKYPTHQRKRDGVSFRFPVKRRISVSGERRLICRVASTPFNSSIPISSTTMSGRSSSASLTPSRPLFASPQTSHPACRSMSLRTPSRTIA